MYHDGEQTQRPMVPTDMIEDHPIDDSSDKYNDRPLYSGPRGILRQAMDKHPNARMRTANMTMKMNDKSLRGL